MLLEETRPNALLTPEVGPGVTKENLPSRAHPDVLTSLRFRKVLEKKKSSVFSDISPTRHCINLEAENDTESTSRMFCRFAEKKPHQARKDKWEPTDSHGTSVDF